MPRTLALTALLALPILAGCAASARPAEARPAAPAMELGAERILVLPLQGGADGGQFDRELAFALRERGPRVVWVGPDQLRDALRRAPGVAADPSTLPADPLIHGGERHAQEALASQLRLYTALVDARLVLLPRLLAGEGGAGDRVRAAVIDSRTAGVVWWGEVAAPADGEAPRSSAAEWAAALARRLVAAPAGGVP